MKILFISNYFTHHQKPLCDALAKRTEFTFLATEEMTQERQSMGWGKIATPDYVCQWDQEQARAEQALEQADVVIVGSAPEKLAQRAIRQNKLIFRYSERPLKKGMEWKKYLPRLVKWHILNPKGKQIYLLCSSAYTAADYAKFGLFRNRAFRWGYFTELKTYPSIDELLDQKTPGSILWTGRFLELKRPGDVLEAAKLLKENGFDFHLTMIGGGEQEAFLRQRITALQLEDRVELKGFMSPQEVRTYMEQSQIYLFTSNRREGWGAVLNESMNSGCALVASHAAGATPYLVENGKNGLIYPSEDVKVLYEKISCLLNDREMARQLGKAAYWTVSTQWNGEAAAQRLVNLAENLLAGENAMGLFDGGPCSKAEILKEGWYKE